MLTDNNNNYIKDTNPYLKYQNENIKNDIVNFYLQYNQLKNIYRQGWIKNKFGSSFAPKCESIADHSFSIAILCLTIIEKYNLDYDVLKCLKLCLIHEFGEVYAGDITPKDNISKEEKHLLEESAIKKLLESLNFTNDYFEIWQEYEAQETKEAIFVKELDTLEFLLQGTVYELDISTCKISLPKIKTDILKDIVKELLDLTEGKNKPIEMP